MQAHKMKCKHLINSHTYIQINRFAGAITQWAGIKIA